jgi:hypothetical protein
MQSALLACAGLCHRRGRGTRLVELVNTMDPKPAANAFGMDPEATLINLADRVDEGRLPGRQP